MPFFSVVYIDATQQSEIVLVLSNSSSNIPFALLLQVRHIRSAEARVRPGLQEVRTGSAFDTLSQESSADWVIEADAKDRANLVCDRQCRQVS